MRSKDLKHAGEMTWRLGRGSLRRRTGSGAGRAAISKGLGMLDQRAIERQVEARVTQLGTPG